MTTAAVSNPLSGHIVGFPGAIPTENWMTDRMLWSDLFGAIWPWDQQPTPKSEAQEDAMTALTLYREEGFFAECVVDHKAFAPNNLQALGHRTAAVRDWVSHFPAEDEKGVAGFDNPSDAYFYINKLGPDVADALIAAGVATTQDGDFIKLRSQARAAHLMSAIAGFARPATSHDLPVTLDAADNRALAAAAMPLNAEEGYPAAVMTIPLIGHEGTRVDPGKLVAFRHNEKNNSARQDYLNTVAAVVADKMVRTVNGAPTTLAAERILTDMQKATTSFADRVKDTLSIDTVAIAAVPVMVPLALNGARLSDTAFAAASAVAVGALKLRADRPHRYVRRAKAAKVLNWA